MCGYAQSGMICGHYTTGGKSPLRSVVLGYSSLDAACKIQTLSDLRSGNIIVVLGHRNRREYPNDRDNNHQLNQRKSSSLHVPSPRLRLTKEFTKNGTNRLAFQGAAAAHPFKEVTGATRVSAQVRENLSVR